MPVKKSRMTKAQKAVAVAKDVLKQMATRRLKPRFGLYFNLVAPRPVLDNAVGKDLRDIAKKATKPCEACAIGSALYSYARLFDEVPVAAEGEDALGEAFVANDCYGAGSINIDEDSIRVVLSKAFNENDIRIMEDVFEHGYAGADFKKPVKTAAGRLKLIMKNVIANKGRFVVPEGGL